MTALSKVLPFSLFERRSESRKESYSGRSMVVTSDLLFYGLVGSEDAQEQLVHRVQATEGGGPGGLRIDGGSIRVTGTGTGSLPLVSRFKRVFVTCSVNSQLHCAMKICLFVYFHCAPIEHRTQHIN